MAENKNYAKSVLNDKELENIAGGREMRESEKRDFETTTAKFNEYHAKLIAAGKGAEARDFVWAYSLMTNQVLNDIAAASEDSEDILFSKAMEPYWPKL